MGERAHSTIPLYTIKVIKTKIKNTATKVNNCQEEKQENRWQPWSFLPQPKVQNDLKAWRLKPSEGLCSAWPLPRSWSWPQPVTSTAEMRASRPSAALAATLRSLVEVWDSRSSQMTSESWPQRSPWTTPLCKWQFLCCSLAYDYNVIIGIIF